MVDSSIPEPGEHLFRTSDGSHLHYVVRGSGPPVIILPPAWGIGSFYLQEGLADLEEKFTLIYLEFRGNAKSTRRSSEAMTSWHLADDVEARHYSTSDGTFWRWDRSPLLEGFDDSQSMGAILAQKRQDPRFHAALETWKSSWDDFSDLEFAETIKKFLPVYFYDPSCASASPLAMLREAPLWNYHMLHGKYRRSKCQEEQLEQVKGEATKQGIKDSKLVVLERCGHFPWMERKEETLDEITQFFERR